MREGDGGGTKSELLHGVWKAMVKSCKPGVHGALQKIRADGQSLKLLMVLLCSSSSHHALLYQLQGRSHTDTETV